MSQLNESLMESQNSQRISDPYILSKKDVETKVKKMMVAFENWEVHMRTTNTATDPGFQKADKKLNKRIKTAEKAYSILSQTLPLIRKNPAKFPHITPLDLQERESFINSAAKDIQTVKDALKSPGTLAKLEADRKDALGGASKVKVCSPSVDVMNAGFCRNVVVVDLLGRFCSSNANNRLHCCKPRLSAANNAATRP